MTAIRLAFGNLFLLFLLLAVSACTEQAAKIEVRGPRDALQAGEARPLPTFARKGDTVRLRALAFASNGTFIEHPAVLWTSTDSIVAAVDASGVVTIHASGRARIRAQTTDYAQPLAAEIEVRAALVAGIRRVAPELGTAQKVITLPIGETVRFAVEVVNERGEAMPDERVRWSTTNWSATVTSEGEVVGRAPGTVQIVAEDRRGDVVRWDARVNPVSAEAARTR